MFTMLGLRTTDETYGENEELSRPTSWAQAGQAGAKKMNPVVAFSLSKQPFSEGSSEYPVGYVSLLGARWALRSKPQELSCWFSFLPQRNLPLAGLLLSWHGPAAPFLTAWLPWIQLALPQSLESLDLPLLAWECGWGWDGCQKGQGPYSFQKFPLGSSFQFPEQP